MASSMLGVSLLLSTSSGIVAASASAINTPGVASIIATDTATLNGVINTDATFNATSIDFCYSTTLGDVTACSVGATTVAATPSTAPISTNQSETATISGLLPGTIYYFNLMTTDSSAAVTYGATPVSFTTSTPLILTSTAGTFGTGLTLTSSGGGGTGAITYAVSAAGSANCSIASGVLNAASTGTCSVTTTQAADANFAASSSSATVVTFSGGVSVALAVQDPLSVTSANGTIGSPLTLTSSGGSGSGAVTFSVTDLGSASCSITSGVLSESSVGTCTVAASKAGDGAYMAASSPTTVITISLANQSPLNVTSTTALYGAGLTLTASGGTGSGAVSYSVENGTATKCALQGVTLRASSPGTCIVTAVKAADSMHAAMSSPATTVTFRPPAKPATVRVAFSLRGTTLSAASKHALSVLAAKLAPGASVRLVGCAQGNRALAGARASSVERFLAARAKVRIGIDLDVGSSSSQVTVITTSQ